MIQFNLLPDIKQEFIRVNRIKRMIIAIASVASAVMIVIVVLLLSFTWYQKHQIGSLTNQISSGKNKLNSMPNLNKILTVQNQLNSLPNLYQQDPVTSRLFGYISEITPNKGGVNELDADFTQNTININGVADSLATINAFVDTLKFATYTAGSSTNQTQAFSSVVLTSFSLSGSGVTYSITANFDPLLFNSANQVTLNVPPEVTTRSVLCQPSNPFQQTNSTNQVTNNNCGF